MTQEIRRLTIPLFAALGLAQAAEPAAHREETVVPFADHGGIRGWRADGSRGIWIRASSGRWYYASFSSRCAALAGAPGVRFIVAPGGVLDRWSSIRLPHDERCFFRTLQPSDAPPAVRPQSSPPVLRDRHSPGDFS